MFVFLGVQVTSRTNTPRLLVSESNVVYCENTVLGFVKGESRCTRIGLMCLRPDEVFDYRSALHLSPPVRR